MHQGRGGWWSGGLGSIAALASLTTDVKKLLVVGERDERSEKQGAEDDGGGGRGRSEQEREQL